MNWIEIIGAIGVGAVITKVLDIFWLPKIMEKIEKREWLRDNRLRAFSKLAKETLSLRLGEEAFDFDNPYKFYEIAAEPMLLIEDSEIKSRINNFIVSLNEIFEIHKAGKEISDSKYNKMVTESRAIVDLLGSLIINNRQTSWIKRLFKR